MGTIKITLVEKDTSDKEAIINPIKRQINIEVSCWFLKPEEVYREIKKDFIEQKH